MMIQEYSFAEETTPDVQAEVLQIVQQSSSLDEVFDYWFLKKGNRLGLSVMINDDDTVNQDGIAVSFDTADGTEVGSVYLLRSEILERYPEAVPFDSFIKGKMRRFAHTEMYDKKYDRWMKSLGFKHSYALMARIGPRKAAMPLMVSFAISKGGTIEAQHITARDYPDEDCKEELEEEGLDMKNYFSLYASYTQNPVSQSAARLMFDPVFCLKTN